jgi:hypothetical protein
MNYKSNLGNIFDSYNPPANLGYSNVSRTYNKISGRSTQLSMQMELKSTEVSENWSSCSKTRERSSGRPKIDSKTILTIKGRRGLSLRTN